jgi:hypothetical protein
MIEIAWVNGVGDPEQFHTGTARQLIGRIFTDDQTECLDIDGWTLSFMVKRHLGDADAQALITKTTGDGIEITGLFNANPDTNQQRAVVTLSKSDTVNLFPGIYECELKRTDAGSESILAAGPFPLVRAVHRA